MKNDGGPLGMWLLSGKQGAALSSCAGHMGLAGQLSFSFHHSLPMLPLPQAQSGDEDIPFY